MVEKSEVTAGQPHFWADMFAPLHQAGQQIAKYFAPSAEASRAEEAYEITLELPGVAQEDIEIELHGRQLRVTGEKSASRREEKQDYFFSERIYGRFQRSFRLPEDVDPDGIRAGHRDGVLTLTIPRRVARDGGARKIEIAAD